MATEAKKGAIKKADDAVYVQKGTGYNRYKQEIAEDPAMRNSQFNFQGKLILS